MGSVLTHNLIHRIPISYLTTGQRVPEDIEEASAAHIIERCLGEIA
jgi:flagellar biosynthesis GTPase FlhF